MQRLLTSIMPPMLSPPRCWSARRFCSAHAWKGTASGPVMRYPASASREKLAARTHARRSGVVARTSGVARPLPQAIGSPAMALVHGGTALLGRVGGGEEGVRDGAS